MSSFLGVAPSPELSHWMPDSACPRCHACRAEFTFTFRKHHCRLCYHIFCEKCSSSFMHIPRIMRRPCVPRSTPPLPCAVVATTSATSSGTSAAATLEAAAAAGRKRSVFSAVSSFFQTAKNSFLSTMVEQDEEQDAGEAGELPSMFCMDEEPLHLAKPVVIPDFAWWLSQAVRRKRKKQNEQNEKDVEEPRLGSSTLPRRVSQPIAIQRRTTSTPRHLNALHSALRSPPGTNALQPSSLFSEAASPVLEFLLAEEGGECWRPSTGGKQRVCNRCKSQIVRVTASENVLRMILGNPYVNIDDWPAFKGVCRQARAAVEFLQRKWNRLAQNILDVPGSPDQVTRKLLAQNQHLLVGHPGWGLLAARAGVAVDWTYPSERFRCCKVLRCHLPCDGDLTIGQCFLAIQKLSSSHPLHEQALHRLRAFGSELVHFMPTLVWLGIRYPRIVTQVVVPVCKEDNECCFQAYFCARAHAALRHVKSAVFQEVGDAQRDEITKSELFLSTMLLLCGPSAVRASARSTIFDRHVVAGRPFLPGSGRYRVLDVESETIKQLNSATQPWVFTCVLHDLETGRKDRRVVMLKNEQVWNDLIVMMAHRYLKAKDPSIGLEWYHVVPLSNTSGMVLFIQDCQSLAAIEKQGSILAHLVDTRTDARAADIQKTFMESCAANAVLSLLFGFGDRHLNNMLVSSAGRLAHIDFAFLWSDEPAVSAQRLQLPDQQIRLTKGMLDVFRTHYYDKFLKRCGEINKFVRSTALELFCVCWTVVAANVAPESKVQSHFNAYMLPYTVKSSAEASTVIVNILESQTRTSSTPLTSFLSKFFHYLERST